MMQDEADQTDAVYRAEGSVLPSTNGRHFSSLAEVAAWLRSITDSAWFRKRFRETGEIELHDGRGSTRARCWKDAEGWHIRLPCFCRDQLGVLHELAHMVAPGDHGREYCSAFLTLVRRFIGADAARNLRFMYLVWEVKHRRLRLPEPWPCDELGTPLF